jgi:SAM-dependent methyltransferase
MNSAKNPTPAEMYEQHIVSSTFVPWTPVLLEKASPRRGEHVLDMACGTGIVARNVAPMIGKKGRLVGVDINPDMLNVASSLPVPEGAAIKWHEADGSASGLPSNSFDLVLCQQGLQFFSDREAGVMEIARVLRKGGRAVVAVWHSLDYHPIWDAVCQSEMHHTGLPLAEVAVPWLLGDAGELQALFDEAGFSQINIISESVDVRYPSAEMFLQLVMGAAAAIIPGLAGDNAKKRSLIEAMMQDTEAILQKYSTDDGLVFPMSSNIVIAHI